MDARDFEKLGAFYLGRVRAEDGDGDDGPRRKDVATELVALGWLPWRTAENGETTPAW